MYDTVAEGQSARHMGTCLGDLCFSRKSARDSSEWHLIQWFNDGAIAFVCFFGFQDPEQNYIQHFVVSCSRLSPVHPAPAATPRAWGIAFVLMEAL